MRETATQSTDGSKSGFTAASDPVDLSKVLGDWQRAGDERLFKLIVSPEFGERINLHEHTRALMARIEQDLGKQLEWVAVAHFNTEHPHAHIALRGVANGQPLRLERGYIKHGFRRHAEDLCTAQLGFRTMTDALEAERREIDQPRVTSLDRTIRRLVGDSGKPGADFEVRINAPGDAASESQRVRRSHLEARLIVLERMGLASSTAPFTWRVRHDFESVLREMQRAHDRQRMLAAHATLLSDPRLPLQYTPASQIRELEGRVVGHSVDEATGQTHMLLEGTDCKVHLIPHTEAIETARNRNLLRPNSFIRLWRRVIEHRHELEAHDFGDADAYLRSPEFLRRAVRQSRSPEGGTTWGGWLGRFQKAQRATQMERASLTTNEAQAKTR